MSTSHHHVFSLPPDLLETLALRNLIGQGSPRVPSPVPAPEASSHGARTCNICFGTTFVDVDEQRAHFRSDWHRYNVKVRLNGGRPVAELDFAQLVDALEDSISGSASSSESSASSESDAVITLMNKSKRTARSQSPASTSHGAPKTALVWFHSRPSTQIGVYKAIFPSNAQPASYLSELKKLQRGGEDGRIWAMFMVAGGHFAGAIVRISGPGEQRETLEDNGLRKMKPKKSKLDNEVLKHKTFHRYTTRRKQGGTQSINDNAKGNAKSAGAQLRRYGEQALREDIRGLLLDWAEEINNCERIWIRASGSNRKIFIDYDNAIIAKGDERLRTFPFPTRRPTQSELTRCLLELTKVKMSYFTEDALRAQDEAYFASLPKPKPLPAFIAPEPEKPRQPKLSREEEALHEKWTRLLEMINKGRLEPLKAFWEREGATLGGIDVAIPEWTGERPGTILQVASQAGQEDVTRWLLEDVRADPTIDVPAKTVGERDEVDVHHSDASDAPPTRMAGSRRTAYDLAPTKGVRNVFRRCAAAHPERWDWLGAARVPSFLSKEMEDERDEKKKVRRKGLKVKVKEREAKERERAKQRSPSPVHDTARLEPKTQDLLGPRKLGGSAGATEGIAGLTPEMRAKVERERRARAAEARMKASGGR